MASGRRGWPHFSGMKGQCQIWHASYRWLCLNLEKLPRSSLLGSPQGNRKEGCAQACPRIIPGKPKGWSCWRRQRGTLDRVSGALLCPRPHCWVFADGIRGGPARGRAAGTWFCSVLRGARQTPWLCPVPLQMVPAVQNHMTALLAQLDCFKEVSGRPRIWATPERGKNATCAMPSTLRLEAWQSTDHFPRVSPV